MTENNKGITANLSLKSKLNATQKMVAEELAYKVFTGKLDEDIAKENDINRTTIWRWKSIPEFNEEVNRIAKEIQKSHLADVNAVLSKLLKSDNEKTLLKAIELYYRNQGLFKDVLETTEKKEISVNIDDLMKELENM